MSKFDKAVLFMPGVEPIKLSAKLINLMRKKVEKFNKKINDAKKSEYV